jgi:glucosamine kinase
MTTTPNLYAASAPTGTQALGLGLDVGGTRTRWALATTAGAQVAQGSLRPFSAQQVGSAEGRATVAQVLADLAHAVAAHGPVQGLWGGVTGHDARAGLELNRLVQEALGLSAIQVHLFNDVELACRLHFAPGAGALVYAGTGAIAVFVDTQGRAHSIGGRGALLGDEGGGYWIARQALAGLWRREDDCPGSAAASALGQALFQAIGGRRWDDTRRFVHSAGRGDFARLAQAVASAADADPHAMALLQQAGQELARLALLMLQRFGTALPLALAGGALKLHPAIEASVRAALPGTVTLQRLELQTEVDAAVRAAATAGARQAWTGPAQP